MDTARKYEEIICNALNCSKDQIPAGNAHKFSRLNLSEKSFEMGIALGEIITSIRYALYQMIQSGNYTDSEESEINDLVDEGSVERDLKSINKVIKDLFGYSNKMNQQDKVR